MPAIRRAVLTLFMAVLCAVACAQQPPTAVAARADVASARTQLLLRLEQRIVALANPSPSSRVVGIVAVKTPLTGSRTVLPVLQSARGPRGGRWLRVRLPMRPNGVSGWVPAYKGTLHRTPWRVVVHLGSHRAVVTQAGKPRASFSVVVGQPSTPTPVGKFFIVEKIRVTPGATEGPWALATSAYSNVLTDFAGGPGQVALHGTVGLSAPLGTSASHGCVRFGPAAITWIAKHVDDGTPLDIRP